MKPFSRADRISGQIQKILSDLLNKKINDPRLDMATVTGVKMSQDLREAYIFFTIYGSDKENKKSDVIDGFKSATGFIKRSLAGRLGLRYMPNLRFIHDESFNYGSQIDALLKSVANDLK